MTAVMFDYCLSLSIANLLYAPINGKPHLPQYGHWVGIRCIHFAPDAGNLIILFCACAVKISHVLIATLLIKINELDRL